MDTQLTAEQIQDLKRAFDLVDIENEGSITRKELDTAMKALGHNVSDTELTILLQDAGADGGSIDFNTFQNIVSRRMSTEDTVDDLRAAFLVFDKKNTGTVRTADIKQYIAESGIQLANDELEEIISEIDPTGEGKIDYSDFASMMKV